MNRFHLARWVDPARLGASLRVRRAVDAISVGWLSRARIGEVSGLPGREVDRLLGRLAGLGALDMRPEAEPQPGPRLPRGVAPPRARADPVPRIPTEGGAARDDAGEATTLMLGLR